MSTYLDESGLARVWSKIKGLDWINYCGSFEPLETNTYSVLRWPYFYSSVDLFRYMGLVKISIRAVPLGDIYLDDFPHNYASNNSFSLKGEPYNWPSITSGGPSADNSQQCTDLFSFTRFTPELGFDLLPEIASTDYGIARIQNLFVYSGSFQGTWPSDGSSPAPDAQNIYYSVNKLDSVIPCSLIQTSSHSESGANPYIYLRAYPSGPANRDESAKIIPSGSLISFDAILRCNVVAS